VQFHIECDTAMFASWAYEGAQTLVDLGIDPVALLTAVDAAMPDLAEVWRPFALRFAGVALGSIPAASPGGPRSLPLLGA
jgi:hypothetical protein